MIPPQDGGYGDTIAQPSLDEDVPTPSTAVLAAPRRCCIERSLHA